MNERGIKKNQEKEREGLTRRMESIESHEAPQLNTLHVSFQCYDSFSPSLQSIQLLLLDPPVVPLVEMRNL